MRAKFARFHILLAAQSSLCWAAVTRAVVQALHSAILHDDTAIVVSSQVKHQSAVLKKALRVLRNVKQQGLRAA